MFFKHNTALGPPYRILMDTNFVNFSIQNKLDIFKASMDCLLGKCKADAFAFGFVFIESGIF